MSNIAYVRVSTVDQNEGRQVKALEKHGIDKWFVEKVSGKNTDRKGFLSMMEYIREGDTVFVHDLSRLARNTKDLLEIVTALENKGVKLVSNKENIDTATATGKLMLTMIGAIAEFERANLLERQKEGIAIAKANGKYKGRKPAEITQEFKDQYARYQKREINKTQLAAVLKISRPTLDKLIKEYKGETEQEAE